MTRTKHTTTTSPAAFIGIDLAKHSVHVYGTDARGRAKTFLSTLASCVIGMEACGRAGPGA